MINITNFFIQQNIAITGYVFLSIFGIMHFYSKNFYKKSLRILITLIPTILSLLLVNKLQFKSSEIHTYASDIESFLGNDFANTTNAKHAHLMAFVIILVMQIANLSSFKIKLKNLMLSNFVFISSIGLLLSKNLISVFFFLECIGIFCSILIWTSGARKKTIGMNYFLSHIFGSAMFLIGLCGYFFISDSFWMDNIVNIKKIKMHSSTLIILGSLINLGIFPFTNITFAGYQSINSNKSLISLLCIPSKVILYFLVVNFSGNKIFLCFGILQMLYCLIKMLKSINLKKILIYNAMFHNGTVLFFASFSNTQSYINLLICLICSFVFLNLFFLSILILIKNNKSNSLSVNNFRININSFKRLFVMVMFLLNFCSLPFGMSYIIKKHIHHHFESNIFYEYIYLTTTMLTLINLHKFFKCFSFEYKNKIYIQQTASSVFLVTASTTMVVLSTLMPNLISFGLKIDSFNLSANSAIQHYEIVKYILIIYSCFVIKKSLLKKTTILKEVKLVNLQKTYKYTIGPVVIFFKICGKYLFKIFYDYFAFVKTRIRKFFYIYDQNMNIEHQKNPVSGSLLKTYSLENFILIVSFILYIIVSIVSQCIIK